jgi:PAS domain S-box-containing protein
LRRDRTGPNLKNSADFVGWLEISLTLKIPLDKYLSKEIMAESHVRHETGVNLEQGGLNPRGAGGAGARPDQRHLDEAPPAELLGGLGLGRGMYAQLLRDMPMPIYLCDAEGRIHFFNEAAAKLWGREPTLGTDLWCGALRAFKKDGEPLPPEEHPIAVALKEGRVEPDAELILERPDGQRRHVVPHPSPIKDATGRIVGAVNVLVDVTDQHHIDAARAAGELAQARLGAIVESSDDAIISKTLTGIITSWNRAAERLFGYTSEEAVGKSILTIIPPERYAEEASILSRLCKGERIDHFETQRVAKDGRMLEVSLTVSPVLDSTGKIIGASKIAREISERKRLEHDRERILEAERHAREEAQRINRVKDEFLATLSHELRTPLNAIMGWSQLMAGGSMSAIEMKEAGEIIERNARTQKQLIEDLLDMSRIISGKLRLDVQRVDPVSVIEAAIETVRASADAKGIEIQTSFEGNVGAISGDPARLQQIVWNLLSNAVKFTPSGGRVRILYRRVNSHMELAVSDTGQGIKTEFLPHLFARFSQADSSTNRKYGGLGLGLAIVKQLVELHGGNIDVESGGEGMGATFTIRLPLRLASRPDSASARHGAVGASEPVGADLSSLTVMIVDDEVDARELMKRLLTDWGADVVAADSAEQALGLMERKLPDVVVSDIGMPTVDGYEFLRRVRRLPGPEARTPAIALTAFARSEDRTRALRAGYIAHVAKPVEPSELLATIAVVAGRVAEHSG